MNKKEARQFALQFAADKIVNMEIPEYHQGHMTYSEKTKIYKELNTIADMLYRKIKE